MAITLPTCPYPNDAQVLLNDFGGFLEPFLGGPVQRINRVGTRFGVRVTLPPMDEDEARTYIARLLQGRTQTVVLPWPNFDFDPGTPGTPLINAPVAGGSTIAIKGLIAGYAVKEGQFFSIVHGGQRYMHMFTAAATANGSGVIASATIFPMLRTNLSVDDVLEIATPKIEGNVLPGDELNWQIGLSNEREVSFSVVEGA